MRRQRWDRSQNPHAGLTNADIGYLLLYLVIFLAWGAATSITIIGAVVLTIDAELLPVVSLWMLIGGLALDFYGALSNAQTWGMLVCAAGALVAAVAASPPSAITADALPAESARS